MINIINSNGVHRVKLTGDHKISIINDRWFIDGKETDMSSLITEDVKKNPIQLTIEGNVDSLESDNLDSVQVSGSVGCIRTVNGNVSCADVQGNVRTVNGSVSARRIEGSVRTVNGNISGSHAQ